MPHDPTQIQQLARRYTEAWCSRDPAQVAGHYVPGGTIAINGGEATDIAEVAQSFIAAFPDIEVFMDDHVIQETAASSTAGHSRGRVPRPARACASPDTRSGRSPRTA
jgi:hypothetical protein